MISHANILSNMAVIAEASDADASTVFVSWLPVFHDMGFFGKVLLPIYLGVLSVLMAPAAFVQKPLRWLQAITKYRGTHCAAPDFAYDLCARKVSDDARAQLDLSSWRVAFNGAEPVRAESVARFRTPSPHAASTRTPCARSTGWPRRPCSFPVSPHARCRAWRTTTPTASRKAWRREATPASATRWSLAVGPGRSTACGS